MLVLFLLFVVVVFFVVVVVLFVFAFRNGRTKDKLARVSGAEMTLTDQGDKVTWFDINNNICAF